MNRILIVEDEENVRKGIVEYLSDEGFACIEAQNLFEAREQLRETTPELILLDWKLPDGQGIDLIKEWRSEGLTTPVIFLTARSEVIDKVLGLELGANDYMTKPFESRELLARIHVQLRTPTAKTDETESVSSRGVRMLVKERRVEFNGSDIETTKMEFDLLQLLITHPGQAFSRDELLNRIWGMDQFPVTRTVDNHVLQLRQKFGSESIETVRGIGYRWAGEQTT